MNELMFEWRKYLVKLLEMRLEILFSTKDLPSYFQIAPEFFSYHKFKVYWKDLLQIRYKFRCFISSTFNLHLLKFYYYYSIEKYNSFEKPSKSRSHYIILNIYHYRFIIEILMIYSHQHPWCFRFSSINYILYVLRFGVYICLS